MEDVVWSMQFDTASALCVGSWPRNDMARHMVCQQNGVYLEFQCVEIVQTSTAMRAMGDLQDLRLPGYCEVQPIFESTFFRALLYDK